jgi:hypothetical protein
VLFFYFYLFIFISAIYYVGLYRSPRLRMYKHT